ncbi:MAG: RluA family pseudouridine synthase [Planctomycetota bacterium]|jgi:RluA family pseudouridine synthase
MEILYRDDHFLAVDKPAGLPSVRERWTENESALVVVWGLLREADGGAPKPRVVHRLDKGTSGVLLFATSREAARSLSRQFKEREVEKTYRAIVLGTPPEDGGTIEVRLEEDRRRPGLVRVVEKKGKPSVTAWTVLERFRGYALLSVRPRTGRLHQVRASLGHLGYPLLVDPPYGGREALFLSELKPGYKRKKDQPERPLIGRVSLHAERLVLTHPVTGERVEIEAPLPKDLTLALKYLRKFRAL